MRYKSKLHELGHRRVEGQIRHCMNVHPEWFSQSFDKRDRKNCVGGLAKRIVGEIVVGADARMSAYNNEESVVHMDSSGISLRINPIAQGENSCAGQVEEKVQSPGRGMGNLCTPPFYWTAVDKGLPLMSSTVPFLVTYESEKLRRRRVTLAIWAGKEHGWKFLVSRYHNARSENVVAWAYYPAPYSHK